MSTQSHTSTGTGILLEAGTSSLEVLRFNLAGYPYGINVAKLREVIQPPEVRPMPHSHPAFEGVFLLRGATVPLIGLRKFLGLPDYSAEELARPHHSLILVTEFNAHVTAYRVDSVDRIWRVSSEQMGPLPRMGGASQAPITAMVKMNDQHMPMLDFETVYSTMTGEGMKMPKESDPGIDRGNKKIVVVEDSATIRLMIAKTLEASGYVRPMTFENGKEAWDWLHAQAADHKEDIHKLVDIVITDIEMPKMDGLQLCRLIRENTTLKHLPVVLFSSLISESNHNKGMAVGATAQISKPQLDQVVELMDRILKLPVDSV